jgi:hypothetical protein
MFIYEMGLLIISYLLSYVLLFSRHRNAGQNHELKIDNRWFENVAQFRYLGTMITNENLIQEESKRRLNTGNACSLICCLKT